MRIAAILLAALVFTSPRAGAEEQTEAGGVPVVDRVKSVQKKPFLKRGRVELSPLFEASVNDAFFQKLGAGARLAWHPVDALAVRAHYARLATIRTDNVRIAKRDLHSRMDSAALEQLAGLDLAWTPLYGKMAVPGGHIAHFDLYLSLGFGAAFTESVDGVHPSASLGAGARFFLSSWLAADVSFTDTLYRERFSSAAGPPLSDLQNALLAGLGLAVYFPFAFKYEAP